MRFLNIDSEHTQVALTDQALCPQIATLFFCAERAYGQIVNTNNKLHVLANPSRSSNYAPCALPAPPARQPASALAVPHNRGRRQLPSARGGVVHPLDRAAGELRPVGRAGRRGTYLFRREELDRW